MGHIIKNPKIYCLPEFGFYIALLTRIRLLYRMLTRIRLYIALPTRIRLLNCIACPNQALQHIVCPNQALQHMFARIKLCNISFTFKGPLIILTITLLFSKMILWLLSFNF